LFFCTRLDARTTLPRSTRRSTRCASSVAERSFPWAAVDTSPLAESRTPAVVFEQPVIVFEHRPSLCERTGVFLERRTTSAAPMTLLSRRRAFVSRRQAFVARKPASFFFHRPVLVEHPS
jgi:hypothetical protein